MGGGSAEGEREWTFGSERQEVLRACQSYTTTLA